MPSSSGNAVQSKKSPMKTGLPVAIMILCNADNLPVDTMLTYQKTGICKYLQYFKMTEIHKLKIISPIF